MKKFLLIFTFLSGILLSQTIPTVDPATCMTDQNLYTSTTNPTATTSYSFSYYSLNPNTFTATNFDWVHTPYLSVYANTSSLGIVTSTPATFISPFYCNGPNSINGECKNSNTALYNDIKSDIQGVYTAYSPSVALELELKAMDITPEDGWELVKYSFGRPTNTLYTPPDPGVAEPNPYIWLYNRYTGKMKLFVAITNISLSTAASASAAIVRITTYPLGKYDLFANAKPFTHIFSDFNHNDDVNAVTNNGLVSLNPAYSGLQYQWLYSEFVTSYDPCVCRQSGSGNTSLNFEIILTQVSTVSLNLSGTSTPIYTTSTSMGYDGSSVNNYKIDDNAIGTSSVGTPLITGAKEVIQGYKDWKEYAETIKGFFSSKTSTGTVPSTNPVIINITNSIASMLGQGAATSTVKTAVAYDFINGSNNSGYNPNPKTNSEAVQILSGLGPLAEDLASAAPFVGAFIALTNFLTNAGSNDNQTSSPPPAPPTAYSLNGKITGSITFNGAQFGGGVDMPGENLNKDMSLYSQYSSQLNSDQPYPIYNNPLGVFNVIEVPNFEYKTISLTNNGVDSNDPNLAYGYMAHTSFGSITTALGGSIAPFANVYDYQLSGPVKYVLNPASNLSVKSIDACYVIEYSGTDPLYIKHGSIIITNSTTASPSNPAGFTSTCTGNNAQKQVPYYPNMKVELDPWNTSLTDPYVYSDDLPTVISGLANTGLDVEYISDSYTSPNGTNGANEIIRFRTQYVPLQSLESNDFILMGSQTGTFSPVKIYLKLFCKFSKNNNPDAEPVTLIQTYDITNKLAGASSIGSGGGGSFNYYYMKDKGTPNPTSNKPGDYAMFSNLHIDGVNYTPNYGTAGPVNISAAATGALSTGDINIATGTTLLSSSSGYQTFAAMNDVVIGDDVKIEPTASTQIATVKARNDITIGKGFATDNQTYTNSSVYYFAGNDITFNDSYLIHSQAGYNKINMYAGKNITLNHNSSYYNIYSGFGSAYISGVNLFAGSQISVNQATNATQITIGGETTLSTEVPVPNIWAILHNDDGSTPIANLAASNTLIASTCSTSPINNRVAHPGDPDSVSQNHTIAKKHLTDESPDYRIGIYPNPTSGNVNVNFLISESSTLQMTIEDLTGKQLFQKKFDAVKGYSQSQMNLEGLMNGVYIIKISSANDGNLIKTGKIILSK